MSLQLRSRVFHFNSALKGTPRSCLQARLHRASRVQSISEISSCFLGPRPWHIEIRHRVKKTSTINLFGFETLKLNIRRLKLWKPTVWSRVAEVKSKCNEVSRSTTIYRSQAKVRVWGYGASNWVSRSATIYRSVEFEGMESSGCRVAVECYQLWLSFTSTNNSTNSYSTDSHSTNSHSANSHTTICRSSRSATSAAARWSSTRRGGRLTSCLIYIYIYM